MRKTHILILLGSLILISVIGFIHFVNLKDSDLKDNYNCVTKTEEKFVRGNSLSGLIDKGSTIKILFGYYNCNEVLIKDIVAYNFSGNAEPIIKIIKGLPGDKFSLIKNGNYWNILINGEIVKNSENLPYQLDEKSYRLLSLYERDYKGVIPSNAYLLLGNLASGSLDGSRFGLIDKSEILGKVIIT